VTEQLVFELAGPQPPSFANFLPGANAEVLSAIGAMSSGTATATGLFLWGSSGAGKTHLLRAAVAVAHAHQRQAHYIAQPGSLLAQDSAQLATAALIAIDNVESATPDAQARIFTLFNSLNDRGGRLVVASRMPLPALPFRKDLQTRLGWGLVYELVVLSDGDKSAALTAYAKRCGFRVPSEVIGYLLAHGPRDMATLTATLSALDRHSLATKQTISVPMLKRWQEREG